MTTKTSFDPNEYIESLPPGVPGEGALRSFDLRGFLPEGFRYQNWASLISNYDARINLLRSLARDTQTQPGERYAEAAALLDAEASRHEAEVRTFYSALEDFAALDPATLRDMGSEGASLARNLASKFRLPELHSLTAWMGAKEETGQLVAMYHRPGHASPSEHQQNCRDFSRRLGLSARAPEAALWAAYERPGSDRALANLFALRWETFQEQLGAVTEKHAEAAASSREAAAQRSSESEREARRARAEELLSNPAVLSFLERLAAQGGVA